MYPEDAMNAKMQAEKAYADKPYYGDQCGTQAATPSPAGNRGYLVRDDVGKSAEFHAGEAERHQSAFRFLSAHPEFDEFIRLVRSGAIRF